tara:strand:- start:427 stop:723 length:297 start_codon:yes stop_codon:yes gene_type:complete
MPRAKVKPPGKKPLPKDGLDFATASKLMREKLNNPDRKDYQRTIAGRGDTHALDGGRIPASKTKRGKEFKKSMPSKPRQPLPVWEDRNLSIRGSKLGG